MMWSLNIYRLVLLNRKVEICPGAMGNPRCIRSGPSQFSIRGPLARHAPNGKWRIYPQSYEDHLVKSHDSDQQVLPSGILLQPKCIGQRLNVGNECTDWLKSSAHVRENAEYVQ